MQKWSRVALLIYIMKVATAYIQGNLPTRAIIDDVPLAFCTVQLYVPTMAYWMNVIQEPL